MIKYILLCCLIPMVVQSEEEDPGKLALKGRRPKGSCHLKKLEACFSVLDQYKNNKDSSELLSNSRGLDDVCMNTQEVMKCIKAHMQKCGTPLQRELVDYLIDELSTSVDRFCKPGEMREEFLKYSPCIVEKVLATANYKESCNMPFLATIDRTNEVEQVDDRVEAACCAYNRWQSCLYEKITESCQEGGKKAMVDFIEKTFGELPSLVCPAEVFDFTSEKCKATYASPGAVPSMQSSRNPITRYITSHVGFLFHH